MDIQVRPWGVSRQGRACSRFLLTNDSGMEVELSDFGALILAIRLPAAGGLRDVTLGFDTLEEYAHNAPGFGAYIGRNGNRIAGGRVCIDGEVYQLEQNDGRNNLHSGSLRSCYECYDARQGREEAAVWVEFARLSPHLEQGFPGDLQQRIRYTLTQDNALRIDYHMVSDQTTVINPTNHTYFNLAGQGSVLEHHLTVFADTFLPTDSELIPTGEERSVAGTPMDFRSACTVGSRLETDYMPLVIAGGYDHNFCFPNDGKMKKMALLQSPDGKIVMSVSSDRPGMQLYSGNFLDGEHGKAGAVYEKRSGICFETQAYPNACNAPDFPTSVCLGGQPFHSVTVYSFRWQ